MTSTLPSRAATAPAAPGEPRAELTGLDLLAGGSLLLLALAGWASLVLAHLGAHSVPAVLGLTVLTAAAAVLLAVRLGRPRVRLRADGRGILVALACAAVAGALTVPGFSYGVADKDPGGYVTHAASISRTGGYSFPDELLQSGAQVQFTTPGARFPGVWVRGERSPDGSCGPDLEGCRVVPQFFHLWPALLAGPYDLAGHAGLFATVPLPGLLSVLCLVALLRRVGDQLLPSPHAGLWAGAAGGLLLATNMLQVWQSRYPTTEVLAQGLYVGALLGVVVALQTGWRPAAGLSGLLVGIGWLNRADGVLLVIMSAGVGALLVAVRRWDGRAWWFLGGLAVVLPHALRQAYDFALPYSLANDVPSLRLLSAGVGGLFVAGALVAVVDTVVQRVRRRPLGGLVRLAGSRKAQVRLGALAVLLVLALLALGFLRPRLFGEAYLDYNGRLIRSYDEQIMTRLTWFFTLPGFALAAAGVAVVALRRWRAAAWAVVLPTLAMCVLYGYTARNSTRLLWWTRRYVYHVLPGLAVLMALALAFFLVWRYRGRLVLRVPGLVALVALLGVFLSQSLPLRGHDEWRGSTDVVAEIAAVSGDRPGLFLFEPLGSPGQGCCAAPTQLFAAPVWLVEGQLSAPLPNDPALRAPIIADYRQRFPDRPLFVVADAGQLPEGLDPAAVAPVLSRDYAFPVWEEDDFARPDEARTVEGTVSVWRVTGT